MTTPLASILPQPETQFCDGNGVPYAGGSVYTYVPNTTTPKNTWQDSGATTLNTNPIVLDSNGRCLMYGEGQYSILLKDSLGNTIYNQLTQDLLGVLGSVAYENIGENLKDDGSGNLVSKITTAQNIAAASTTNLGSLTSDVVTVSGNTTITSFGSSANAANPIYLLTFSGAPLLTYNATSLILPTSANIQVTAGDTAIMQYLGSGNWRCLSYNKISGQALSTPNLNIQAKSSSVTYTPSTGLIGAIVRVVGGGGGGGGANVTNAGGGGGGGAGAFAEAYFTAATIGSSQTITIGAGGSAGNSSGGNGGTGGTTSFGTLLVALGGSGGTGDDDGSNSTSTAGGLGGATGVTGELVITGGTGGVGGGLFASAQNVSFGGVGGASYYGGGGGGGYGSSGTAGGAGFAYGSGGGGGSADNGSNTGGAGAAGLVEIIEYIG